MRNRLIHFFLLFTHEKKIEVSIQIRSGGRTGSGRRGTEPMPGHAPRTKGKVTHVPDSWRLVTPRNQWQLPELCVPLRECLTAKRRMADRIAARPHRTAAVGLVGAS
jgi:hypothetical protein